MRRLDPGFLKELEVFLSESPDKERLSKKKVRLAGKYGLKNIPTDIEVYLNLDDPKRYEKHLLTKPTRTISGVAVVALMTKPMSCPHGKCIYCPGGVESDFGDMPQSYTGREPSTMRALRNNYDAYLTVMNRLEQYIVLGQNPDKIDLIVMGGTFPSFPERYQVEFIASAFKAMNDFSEEFYEEDRFDIDKFREFFELPGDKDDKERIDRINEKLLRLKGEQDFDFSVLEEEKKRNERSNIRCIGLTIETKPDHGFIEHGNRMLSLGCTRLELGVQTTYDSVLRKVNRGHGIEETKRSVKELRDLGFKLNFHMMPGLPGVSYEDDLASFKELFESPDYRPDMLKIYPLMVFKNTGIYEMYKRGEYTPIDTEYAAKLIAEVFRYIPRYVRVMRVQRDIPASLSAAGVMKNNLRQYVDEEMKEKGIKPEDIRAREIGHVLRGKEHDPEPEINVIEYDASGGKEFFISIDDKKLDAILGFCRLRFPSKASREEFTDKSAMIRELHVYGKSVAIGKEGDVQHKGYGKQLMEKAESIARKDGKDKILVISGVGVRGYYRKLGYELEGPYMTKTL
ncbi:MAG: tRNA uridine(34) 5-carboxymethylaminomethyl modification radical SAM/GNAT enzyme Elp3 [Nanobdellota archaeon]